MNKTTIRSVCLAVSMIMTIPTANAQLLPNTIVVPIAWTGAQVYGRVYVMCSIRRYRLDIVTSTGHASRGTFLIENGSLWDYACRVPRLQFCP